MYEEWVAHPDQHAFVHQEDSQLYAQSQGWWRTAWKGTATDVVELGQTVVPRFGKRPAAVVLEQTV